MCVTWYCTNLVGPARAASSVNFVPSSSSCYCFLTLKSIQNVLSLEMTKTLDTTERHRLRFPVVLAFILYNLLSFATLLLEVPLVRLFEKSICNRYYRQHPQITNVAFQDVVQSLCKGAGCRTCLRQWSDGSFLLVQSLDG